MSQQAVSISFYDCPFKSFEETIAPCDAELYNWLVSIDPARPAWTPQHEKEIAIYAAVMQKIVDDQNACEESRFASQGTPESGVSVTVSARLSAGSGSAGEADTGLRSSVSIDFAPPAPPAECPPIQFHILNIPEFVGNTRYPDNVNFGTNETAPPLNGSGNFSGSIIFATAMQTYGWRDVIHSVFTGGTWNIEANIVFGHYAPWIMIDNPTPSAELQARMEAFALENMSINGDLYNGRFRVLHRYTHQQSGRVFWFDEWHEFANGWADVGPPTFGTWGKSFAGNLTHSSFEVPDLFGSDFFDPEGTWLHQSGIVDFAATFAGQVKYHGDLCDEFLTTFSEASIDPETTGFLSSASYFEEVVEVKTIKQYKAAYRVTDIQPIFGVGLKLTVRLINDFAFQACIVARMPIGNFARHNGITLANYTVIVARNLSANSESEDIDIVIKLMNISSLPSSIDYKISDVIYDTQNGGGIVEHGFACAPNAYADGEYITTITSDASAIVATTDGQRAEMWGFYNQAGIRFWTQFGAYGGNSTDTVFAFTPPSMPGGTVEPWYPSPLGCALNIYCEWWDGSSWSPPTWGTQIVGFTVAEARARYGTFLDISTAGGYNDGYGNLIYFTWPGGDSDECAAGLLQKLIDAGRIRNVVEWNLWENRKPIFMIAANFLVSSDDPIPSVGYIVGSVCTDYVGPSSVKVRIG